LIVRLLGVLVTLRGSLALLARLLTAALLLAGLLTRRLILLTGLVLVRHGISFHRNVSISLVAIIFLLGVRPLVKAPQGNPALPSRG
jgi:hypothetical protein